MKNTIFLILAMILLSSCANEQVPQANMNFKHNSPYTQFTPFVVKSKVQLDTFKAAKDFDVRAKELYKFRYTVNLNDNYRMKFVMYSNANFERVVSLKFDKYYNGNSENVISKEGDKGFIILK